MKNKMNYKKLKGRIIEKVETCNNLAVIMGMSKSSISNKLNNKTEFSQKDIMKIMKILEIPFDELSSYFFTEEVEKNATEE